MRSRICVIAIAVAAVALSAQTPDLRTRAESTDYVETSSYDDVLKIVNGIVSSSSLAKQESFGTTEEGRSLPLLILSDPPVTSPGAAERLRRPVVFIQANIHAGEVEGKEASLKIGRAHV